MKYFFVLTNKKGKKNRELSILRIKKEGIYLSKG